MMLIFVSIILVLIAFFLYLWLTSGEGISEPQKSENDRLFRVGVAELVDCHIETLARQRLQLIKNERYGSVDTSKWDAEIQVFIDRFLFPELLDKDKVVFPKILPRLAANKEALSHATKANDPLLRHVQEMFNPLLREVVEERAKRRAAEIEADLSFSNDMTPLEFERWCVATISSNGWSAILTKATGDQGADVIAEKNGNRLVIQCKLYSSPVGNSAVQEAFSAQHHYQANASAVVTNATFTASAMALAKTTGVQLLHYTDLSRLSVGAAN